MLDVNKTIYTTQKCIKSKQPLYTITAYKGYKDYYPLREQDSIDTFTCSIMSECMDAFKNAKPSILGYTYVKYSNKDEHMRNFQYDESNQWENPLKYAYAGPLVGLCFAFGYLLISCCFANLQLRQQEMRGQQVDSNPSQEAQLRLSQVGLRQESEPQTRDIDPQTRDIDPQTRDPEEQNVIMSKNITRSDEEEVSNV
jgi:hypothetical protein